mmetsp:Transcript_33270/g.53822  ORF Transcript_33270/g.53822 Transcript_33270/m.53822 type:complete len:98 (+) Transcript_33270:271-564(+)
MNRFRIWAWMDTSSALTGSSATTMPGFRIMARAIAMRWRWPPENSCGYLAIALSSSPTRCSRARARASRSALSLPMPWISIGSRRVCPIVKRGFSEA